MFYVLVLHRHMACRMLLSPRTNCDVKHDLDPDKVDWFLPTNFHKRVIDFNSVGIMNAMENGSFLDDLPSMNGEKLAARSGQCVYLTGSVH